MPFLISFDRDTAKFHARLSSDPTISGEGVSLDQALDDLEANQRILSAVPKVVLEAVKKTEPEKQLLVVA